MSGFAPTEEQEHALGLFASGSSLAIEAGAGTGKTSTLELLARSTRRQGQYVAFNRAIVNEAERRFPMSVRCRTAHGLAFASYGRQFGRRLNSNRITSAHMARLMGIDGPINVTTKGAPKPRVLQPAWQAAHVMRAIARFCESADPEPDVQHFPYVDGLDTPEADGTRTYGNNRELARALVGTLRDAWVDLTNPDGRLRFSHGVYLKLWQLSKPQIAADFVLFDEAQDASPVMLDVIQGQTHAQLVWVGDSQQQIYEWRGAVNALASVDVACRAYLTQSWRFGPAIADAANLCLDRLSADLRITGTPAIPSTIGRPPAGGLPDAVLCRSNAAALETVMNELDAGRQPHLVGGGRQIVDFAKAADSLMSGDTTWHPELSCFGSWREVQDYVANDPQGDELALMVRVVDEYGVDRIIEALDDTVAEDAADVTVSTAHKAKGREWNHVRLAGDFTDPGHDTDAAGEWRLLYVAATRAKLRLDHTSCEPLVKLLGVGALA